MTPVLLPIARPAFADAESVPQHFVQHWYPVVFMINKKVTEKIKNRCDPQVSGRFTN
jgi:hypothetical protein